MKIREFGLCCESKAKYCWSEIVSYLHANSTFLLFALGVILCSYSYELFNQTLSIDDEFLIWSAVPSQAWIRQGRWGMYLISCIFINPCIPFATLFLTLVLNAVAFLIVFRCFVKSNQCYFLLFPLFIAMPISYFAYTFNSLLPGLGVGSVCAAIAVRFASLARSRWLFLLPAIILGAFAIGCYQAMLNLLMLLCLFFLIYDLIVKQETMRMIGRQILAYFLFGVGALALYYVGDRLAMKVSGNTAQPYLDNFFVQFEIFQALKSFFYFVWRVYRGATKIYGFNLLSQGILFVGCMGILIGNILFLQISWCRKVIALVAISMLIFIPFSLCLILNFWEIRGLFSVSWILPCLFLLAWRLSGFMPRLLLGGVLVVCVFQYLFVNNKLAYANELSFERDKTLAIRILKQIDELPINKIKPHATPLMILGQPDIQVFPQTTPFYCIGTIGKSIFNQDGGNPSRVNNLFIYLGNNLFRPASIAEQKKIVEKAINLPYFPRRGSVALIDGIVVIVFSSPSYPQIKNLDLKTHDISLLPDVAREYQDLLQSWKTIYQVTEDNTDFSHAHLLLEKGSSGTIPLRILGDDPQFFLPRIPVDITKKYLMEFILDYDHEDEFQMFFKNSERDPYSGIHQIKLKMNQGENRFILRVSGRIFRFPLRLDPGYGKAKHVVIKRIAVLEQKHE